MYGYSRKKGPFCVKFHLIVLSRYLPASMAERVLSVSWAHAYFSLRYG